jgi:hypothetical protein
MAVATAAQARVYIRGLTGTSEDTVIDTLLARADSVMASYLGMPAATVGGDPTLEDVAHTLILDGPAGVELRLPFYPVQSVTSVHDSADRSYGAADLIDAADYTVHGAEGIIRLDDDGSTGSFSGGRRAIQVVAVIGWATIPGAIVHAACIQAAHWFNARDHIGRSSVSQQGGSISVATLGLLPEVIEALAPYRLPVSWVA